MTHIEVQLNRGQIALIDEIDADIADVKWIASYQPKLGIYYAQRSYETDRVRTYVSMHREILGRKVGRPLERAELTDHINGHTLDNRRSNLRIANRSQNRINSTISANNTSGYRGVYRSQKGKPWRAQLRVAGANIALGSYDTPEEAYAAYCKAALEHFGEFARLS